MDNWAGKNMTASVSIQVVVSITRSFFPITITHELAHFLKVEQVTTYPPRVIGEETSGEADRGERPDDVNTEKVNSWSGDDDGEFNHIHKHVEGVLDTADHPSLRLFYVLL